MITITIVYHQIRDPDTKKIPGSSFNPYGPTTKKTGLPEETR